MREAIENDRKAIASYERLAKYAAAEPEYQHGLTPWDWHMLARCYGHLCELLAQASDFQEAEKAVERSVRIYIRITEDFPSMPDFWIGLAESYNKFGELYARCGKQPEAETEFRKASKIRESLRNGSNREP
jgi:tetratricopeptide (TPR) repeat protein